MQSFVEFLQEAVRTAAQITTDPRYQALSAAERRLIDPYLTSAATDPAFADNDLTLADKMLDRVRPVGHDAGRDARFAAIWKTQPSASTILRTPSYGDTARRFAKYWQLYAAWLRTHFGGSSIWTDRLLMSYRIATGKEHPQITYQGRRYSLQTGLDEKDFVRAVVDAHKVTF